MTIHPLATLAFMMIVMRMISLKDNDQDNYYNYYNYDYLIMMVYMSDPPSSYSCLHDDRDENGFLKP